jgi:hypothetical protein
MKRFVSFLLFGISIVGCGSDDSTSAGASSGSAACPNLAGQWKVSAHCDPSLVGKDAVVTQSGCSLTFASPFNGFTGSVTADNKVTLSGPQSCTGTASSTSITMSCTPGTCTVTLAR